MSRRKGPRGLSPEEEELWQKIAARTRPMRPVRGGSTDGGTVPPSREKESRRAAPIKEFEIGRASTALPASYDLAPDPSDELRKTPVRMDRKSHQRMVRGRLAPEARIDLHGMTLDAAQPALTRFIADSHDRGRRLVLVITGKGKMREDPGPIPVRPGVLRHQVPQWLTSGALRTMVLQVTEAHPRHGGSGAYYVYLRRRK